MVQKEIIQIQQCGVQCPYLLGAEASSIMSGSSSLSSMSTPASTVVETYHAPDGGWGWVSKKMYSQLPNKRGPQISV